MFPPQNRNLWFPEEKTEGASFPCSIHGLVRFHSPMKTAWLKNSGYQRYQSVSWWTPFGILPPFAGLEQSHFGWHFFLVSPLPMEASHIWAPSFAWMLQRYVVAHSKPAKNLPDDLSRSDPQKKRCVFSGLEWSSWWWSMAPALQPLTSLDP